MSKKINPMDKFDFLLGNWKLKYKVPKSQFSTGDSGEGEGSFKKILNKKYIVFDYHAKLSAGEGGAHGIFAWDKRRKIYRYWWFEDTGEYSEASCEFLDENMLCLNWHDSILVQTFQKLEKGNKILLQMRYPLNKDDYKTALEVLFKKK